MKKVFGILMMMFVLFNTSFADVMIFEKPDVKIIVQGEELELGENIPIIVNSRTLVPLRKLLVGLGVPDNDTNIQWIAEKMAVKVDYNGVIIDLAIGSSDGYINGQKYTLDCVPVIHKDRTYLPARFVGEALGYTVSWDPYTPAVIVTDNKNMEVLTDILTDIKTAINNVQSYEVMSEQTSIITSWYGDTLQESEIMEVNNISIERGDLVKKIIYSENHYKDPFEKSFTFDYSTEDAVYSRYKYEEEGTLHEEPWEKFAYDPQYDSKTPYDEKSKLGLVKLDDSLSGALLCVEDEESYVLFTPTKQIDILKALYLDEVYENAVAEGNRVEKFYFIMGVNKETKLPEYFQIDLILEFEEKDENGKILFRNKEDMTYKVLFNKYNHYLELNVPEV